MEKGIKESLSVKAVAGGLEQHTQMEEGDKRTEGGEGGRGRELSSGPQGTSRGAGGRGQTALASIQLTTRLPAQLMS